MAEKDRHERKKEKMKAEGEDYTNTRIEIGNIEKGETEASEHNDTHKPT